MLTRKQRDLLFIFGCLGVRTAIAILAKNASSKTLQIYGKIALIPAFVWMYFFFTNTRQTGMEANGRIWWNNVRPLHALLYFGFAYAALKQNKNAYLFLVADVILGGSVFLLHRNNILLK